MNTRRERAIEIITAGLFFWDGAPDGWNNFEAADAAALIVDRLEAVLAADLQSDETVKRARAAYFAARNESSSWSSNEGQIRAALCVVLDPEAAK